MRFLLKFIFIACAMLLPLSAKDVWSQADLNAFVAKLPKAGWEILPRPPNVPATSFPFSKQQTFTRSGSRIDVDWILDDVARINISGWGQGNPKVQLALLKIFGATLADVKALENEDFTLITPEGSSNSASVEISGMSIIVWRTADFEPGDHRALEASAVAKKRVLEALAKDILPEEK